MILEDKNVAIQEIFLDPYNPRFLTQENSSQDAIFAKIFSSKGAKELLNSMKINIKWVNKIVVIEKKDFTSLQKKIIGIDSAEYLIVEGNNRLACLKSDKIEGIEGSTLIPVILAKKEENETEEDFAAALRVTQGIANVMVVKEWGVISKARHLYNMYNDQIRTMGTNDIRPHDIYRRMAYELGIGLTEVRQSVIRYEFYKTIGEISDSIPNDQWGFLEAFDKNKDTREKFGMSSETNRFNFDMNDESYYEELVKEIPALIRKANSERINTKQFRDILQLIISKNENPNDLLEEIQGITESKVEYYFRNILTSKELKTEKEEWVDKLNQAYDIIQNFPNIADWALEYKEKLQSIAELISRHIEIIK